MNTRPGSGEGRPRGPKWIVAPHGVLEDVRLTETDLRVLLALCWRAENEEGERLGQSWPSLKRIALDARCGRTSVLRSLPRLVDFGWITTQARWRADGSADSTLYTVKYDNRLPAAITAVVDLDSVPVVVDGGPNLDPPPSTAAGPTRDHSSGPTPYHSSGPRGGTAAVDPERLRGTNTAPPAAGARDGLADTANVRTHLDPRSHSVYDALCAKESHIGATAALLALIVDPLTGGERYTWPEVSAALIEMQGNAEFGGRVNAPLIRGVCRQLRRGANRPAVVGDLLGTQRAQLLWSLSTSEGLAQATTRDALIEKCEQLAGDVRVMRLGCASGRALFELLCAVRITEFANRHQRDERFIVRDIADRLGTLSQAAS